ncbi:hypothetical protein [Mycobacteroides abscessus]|uniref:hypothetical protein n=1 Tax=Mycobacteroides abscessus TaxID=36809 RepID=UPI001F26BFB6|nr:hypothetical protein [Mycobacteroides abscessus]
MSPPKSTRSAVPGGSTALVSEALIAELERQISLDVLPHVAMTKHVAALIGSTESVLSQERYLGRSTIPYTKIGRRVRYLRPDVIAYLAHHRVQGAA